MKPDSSNYNPDPDYLRSLLERAALSQNQAARVLGVDPGTFRLWLRGGGRAPYAIQYALEQLADRTPEALANMTSDPTT